MKELIQIIKALNLPQSEVKQIINQMFCRAASTLSEESDIDELFSYIQVYSAVCQCVDTLYLEID